MFLPLLFENIENIEKYERKDLINFSEKVAMWIFTTVLVISLIIFIINDFVPNVKLITYQPLFFTLSAFVLLVNVLKLKSKILDIICHISVVIVGIMALLTILSSLSLFGINQWFWLLDHNFFIVYSFVAAFFILVCSFNEKYYVISQLLSFSILIFGFCGFLYYTAFQQSAIELALNFLLFRLIFAIGSILMFPRTNIVRPLFLSTDGSRMARWTMVVVPVCIMIGSGVLYYLDAIFSSPLNWNIIMDGFILVIVLSLMTVFSMTLAKSNVQEKESAQENIDNVKFYEKLIETMDEYVLVTDTDYNVIYANDQICSKSRDKKFLDSFLNNFSEEYEEAKHNLKSTFIESKVISLENNENYELSGWMTPFIDDGKFDGMVVTLMNVSDGGMSVLKASIEEKNILLAEVHHRVKNNMQIINSLLSLESNKYNDDNIASLVKKIQVSIRTMALIHENLYQNLDFTSVNIKNYVDLLVNDIKKAYSVRNVLFTVDCVNTSFDIDTILPLGLIINETCINAVKYAFPEEIDRPIIVIALYDHGHDDYELIIQDNGKGIQKHNDNTLTGFGSTLVDALTMQLEGEISYDVNNGTKITVKFSAKHY